MKELILQIDRLVSMIPVSGDAVLVMADARKALGELYKMAPEEKAGRALEGEKEP